MEDANGRSGYLPLILYLGMWPLTTASLVIGTSC
jgi:hypothetical protein